MTLLELVKHLRTSILDDRGGTGSDWESVAEDDIEAHQLKWSNEELTSYINEAINKVARGTLCLKKAEPAFSITTEIGKSEYALDSRIIRLKQLTLSSNGRELYPIELEELTKISNWRNRTGNPTNYVIDETSRSIRIYPQPVAVDTIDLVYYRYPLVPLDWNSNCDDLELPEEYQMDMLYWAAHLAYLKDEPNTLDPSRVELFRQLFIKEFSDNNAYSEVRRRRSRGRGARYRDLL